MVPLDGLWYKKIGDIECVGKIMVNIGSAGTKIIGSILYQIPQNPIHICHIHQYLKPWPGNIMFQFSSLTADIYSHYTSK